MQGQEEEYMIKKLLAGIMSLVMLSTSCYAASTSSKEVVTKIEKICNNAIEAGWNLDDERVLADLGFFDECKTWNCEGYLKWNSLSSFKKKFVDTIKEFIESRKSACLVCNRCDLHLFKVMCEELKDKLPPEISSRLEIKICDGADSSRDDDEIIGIVKMTKRYANRNDIIMEFEEIPDAAPISTANLQNRVMRWYVMSSLLLMFSFMV